MLYRATMPTHVLLARGIGRSLIASRSWAIGSGGGSVGGINISRCLSAAPRKNDVALIRELREASGAPMVDCKKALAVRSMGRTGFRTMKDHVLTVGSAVHGGVRI